MYMKKAGELDYVMNAVAEERYSGTFTPRILIALIDPCGCMKLKSKPLHYRFWKGFIDKPCQLS